MKLVCSSCSAENRNKAKFCKKCGRKLKKQVALGLEDIVGRNRIKDQLNRLVQSLNQYKKGWNSEITFNKNMILTGNSGTGKTSLVNSIALLFSNHNLISKKEAVVVDASEFDNFITELNQQFVKAENGILFIDNFHKIVESENNTGANNLDKLFYKIDKEGKNTIVIIVGEPAVTDQYFFNNPSHNNLFEFHFRLHDFSSSELYDICKQKIEQIGLQLTEDSANKLLRLFRHKVKTKNKSFGNAHYALNAAEDIALAYYHRIAMGADDDKIISAEDIRKNIPKEKTLNEVFKELDSFIGMENVKSALRDIAVQIQDQQKLKASGHGAKLKFGFHMVLTGNPGTGKTTVVRKLGEILSAINYLDRGHVVEVDKSKLVGQYVGETPKIVQKKCDDAMGGILFIDEAYALAPRAGNKNQFGLEAIDTLLKRMEDDRDKFVVVAAGYENEMQHFINSNSGLKSRFDRIINLKDYTPEELTGIFKIFVNKNKYVLSSGAEEILPKVVNEIFSKRDKIFGNGREMRKLFEETVINLSKRVAGLPSGSKTTETLTRIEPEDFSIEIDKEENLDDIFTELNSLIGLDELKGEFQKLTAYIKVEQKRKELGAVVDKLNNHFVFMGNPGTGKTTVARLLGKIFKSLGVLSKGHVIEVDRAGLVAQYVGQTAAKTNEVIDSAMGGVLFIDEAYSLIVNDAKNDFGQQAIQALLKRMEDDADRFVVIVAGYPNEMGEFINANPGLHSRFKRKIIFPDYNSENLYEIFELMLNKRKLKITEEAAYKAKAIFKSIYLNRDKNFGNGRTVRNKFESVLENQSLRLAGLIGKEEINESLLNTIEAEDITE